MSDDIDRTLNINKNGVIFLLLLIAIILTLLPLPIPQGNIGLFLIENIKHVIFLSIWYLARPMIAALAHYYQKIKYRKVDVDGVDFPSLSVIIPAYNEEDIIEESVKSVLNQQYPSSIEILVVDDGSTDNTWTILQRLSQEYESVRVFHQENQGAGTAQNYALSQSTNEVIIKLDADTTLVNNALTTIARPFVNSEIVGVGGNVQVLNDGTNMWTKIQSFEYALAMEIGRTFQSRLRHLLCISGAFGAFRREELQKVGGWVANPDYGEDFDITVRLQKYGTVWFIPEAIALTDVPDTFQEWARQRYRWTRNGLRTIILHRNAMFNPDFGVAGVFGLPLKLVLLLLLLISQGGVVLLLGTMKIELFQNVVVHTYLILGLVTAMATLLLLVIAVVLFVYEKPIAHFLYLPVYFFLYRPLHGLVRMTGTVVGIIWVLQHSIQKLGNPITGTLNLRK